MSAMKGAVALLAGGLVFIGVAWVLTKALGAAAGALAGATGVALPSVVALVLAGLGGLVAAGVTVQEVSG